MGRLCRAGARPGGRGLTSRAKGGWVSLEESGQAAQLVSTPRGRGPRGEPSSESPGQSSSRQVRHCKVTDRALVLGSSQPAEAVDASRCVELGVSIVRRRSGGGAVFVAPGSQVWIDVFLPRGDPLLDSDVGRSFLWLGAVWAEAVTSLQGASSPGCADLPRPYVVLPGLRASTFARQFCFGGLGAGEVTVAGRKVVGLSQRRDRSGAWFHSMALIRGHSKEIVECMKLDEQQRSAASQLLSAHSGTLAADERAVVQAFLSALP
ncbi:MAG: lipoyl protein ligase domain-containing protein [Acidimicrobiales bacterium]